MTAQPQADAPPAIPGLFWILGALAAFMPVAMDLYLPALPALGRDLGASPGAAQLTLSSFLLGVAFGQFLYGPASDRFGRRPPLLLGTALFAAASIGCAFATSIEALIALRAVQGLGAACGMVITRAIVFEAYGVREGARYMSLLMLVMGIAPIIAPLIGGWIVVHSDWRVTFHAVAAFAALALLASAFLLPETRNAATAQTAAGESILQACVAVVRNGPLMRFAAISALGGASFFTYLSSAPSLLIETYGIPPDQFGFYFGANAIAFIFAAQLNRALLARRDPLSVLNRASFAFLGLAGLLLAGAFLPGLGMWAVLAPLFFLIGSFPFVNQNAAAIAQGEDLNRAGAVSAVLGAMSIALGAALGALSGLLHDGTARPMAVIIFCACAIAFALQRAR